MLQSVRLNRPQNGSRDVSDDLNRVESKELWRNVFLRPQFNNNGIGNPQVVANVLIDQLYRQSPPHGPRNLVWLQRFRAMESSLGEFWAAVRRWAKKYLGHLDLRAMEEKVLMDSISVDLSPEYLQLRREQADRIISDAKREPGPSPVPLQTEWGSEAIAVPFSISGPRVKSRPTASGNTTGETAHNGDRTPETPNEFSQQIFVTKDSLHVIHLMFPEFSDRSDSVGWEKFVRALCDAGFVARNGGGSAVVFDAQNGLQRGKIVFHRPHPVAKLDPVMLRSMGKRMTKWFGWTRNEFSAK
ncbi:hypothetical protein N7490_012003 [Penicillium lividum]|nr:hypothetical protein N7490_012003 [Penicillium lividum]